MIDLDFIKRCSSEEFQEIVNVVRKENNFRSNKWQTENPKKQNECNRRYSKTEKGKVANKKKVLKYKRQIKELSQLLDDQDKEAIRLFYVNCPDGYEVDHVIPISKGGEHHIRNLQYLTPKENRSKGYKLDWKPTPAQP